MVFFLLNKIIFHAFNSMMITVLFIFLLILPHQTQYKKIKY